MTHKLRSIQPITAHSIGLQQDKIYHTVEYPNLPTQIYHRPIDIWLLTKVGIQCINHNTVDTKLIDLNTTQLNPIDIKDCSPTQKTQNKTK